MKNSMNSMKRISLGLSVVVLAVVMTAVALAACAKSDTGANAARVGMQHVDFLIWPSGDAYTKVAKNDITETHGTVTVKVPHDYDMVGKGLELDMKGFFIANNNEGWGKDLYCRRSDNSYAANEVGRAYELKSGTSNVWVRTGVTPEEIWTAGGTEPAPMSSRVMLAKGADGKILNYIFFADSTVVKKEVIYTVRTHHGRTHTLTVVVEKKTAPAAS